MESVYRYREAVGPLLCDRAEDRPRGSEGRDLARRCTIIALGSGGELATIIEYRAMTHSLTIHIPNVTTRRRGSNGCQSLFL